MGESIVLKVPSTRSFGSSEDVLFWVSLRNVVILVYKAYVVRNVLVEYQFCNTVR